MDVVTWLAVAPICGSPSVSLPSGQVPTVGSLLDSETVDRYYGRVVFEKSSDGCQWKTHLPACNVKYRSEYPDQYGPLVVFESLQPCDVSPCVKCEEDTNKTLCTRWARTFNLSGHAVSSLKPWCVPHAPQWTLGCGSAVGAPKSFTNAAPTVKDGSRPTFRAQSLLLQGYTPPHQPTGRVATYPTLARKLQKLAKQWRPI